MAEEEPPLPKVRIRVQYAREHRTVAATGCWGSVMPTGSIHISLHHDHLEHPPSVIRDQETMENAVEEPSRYAEITRVMEVSAILTPADAHSIGKWLLEKAEEATRMQAEVIRAVASEQGNADD